MIQTVAMAQALFAKAALVDYERLLGCAASGRPGAGGDMPAGRLRDGRAAGDRRVAPGSRSS